MKEATGELNMTVITVVAIAAVAAFFYAIVWPAIKTSLAKNTCENGGNTWSSQQKCCMEPNGNKCIED